MRSIGVIYNEYYCDASAYQYRYFKQKFDLQKLMWFVVSIQILSVLILLTLQILYFRKSLFLQIIPICVILLTAFAIVRRKQDYVWPTIALSCFHIVFSLYMAIIFLFYYLLKPLYIIMVLNWAFDTQYTGKTVSYYVQSAIIFISIVTFGLYNYWQLTICNKFKKNLQAARIKNTRKVAPLNFVVNNEDHFQHPNPLNSQAFP